MSSKKLQVVPRLTELPASGMLIVAAAFRRRGEHSWERTMSIGSKAWLFACALGLSFGPIGAKAVPVTPCTCTYNLSSPSGVLGTTQTYTMRGPGGPVTITAKGFTGGFASPVNLFGKNDGGNENGLGLTDDPAGANEISGTSFIRINFPEFTVSPRGFAATGAFQVASNTPG